MSHDILFLFFTFPLFLKSCEKREKRKTVKNETGKDGAYASRTSVPYACHKGALDPCSFCPPTSAQNYAAESFVTYFFLPTLAKDVTVVLSDGLVALLIYDSSCFFIYF